MDQDFPVHLMGVFIILLCPHVLIYCGRDHTPGHAKNIGYTELHLRPELLTVSDGNEEGCRFYMDRRSFVLLLTHLDKYQRIGPLCCMSP